MPSDVVISHAVLEEILEDINLALQQPRARDCGNIMFRVKERLNQLRLTPKQAFARYFTGEPQRERTEFVEDSPEAEKPTADAPTQETQPSRTYYKNMNESVPDPNTWWVVPWAEKMERALSAPNKLPPKDVGHLTRMQTARTQCVRNNRELVWLRDIAHRIQQTIIKEYWDWWDTLTPEQQEEANNRQ